MTIGEPAASIDFLSIPEVDPQFFEGHERARFWIGRVALDNVIERPDLYVSSLRLRANVYIDEMGFLPETHRTASGLETDTDDERSVHFSVTEKSKDGTTARLIGTSRLIAKRDEDDVLPIERLFPEIFEDEKIKEGCVEVSRFISRHEDEFTQHKVALSLIRAMTHHCVSNEVSNVYFVVEEPLWRLLTVIGLPMEKLSDAKRIEEYADTENMAVRINPQEVIEAVTHDKTGTLLLTQFFREEGPNEGLGFYKSALVGGGNV